MRLTSATLSQALNDASDQDGRTALRVVDEPEARCSLWAGFGQVYSAVLTNKNNHIANASASSDSTKEREASEHLQVIVKVVSAPPRTDLASLSSQRKVLSYRNEAMFYRLISPELANELSVPTPYAIACSIEENGTWGGGDKQSTPRTDKIELPKDKIVTSDQQRDKLATDSSSDEQMLLLALRDISSEFPVVPEYRALNLAQAQAGIIWLARFHTWSLDVNGRVDSLATQGTYWYLDTRPDEFEELKADEDEDAQLLAAAGPAVDYLLKTSPWQTLVHGDFKGANLQFTEEEHEQVSKGNNDQQHISGSKEEDQQKQQKQQERCRAVAYDFQYVGRGSPMKDVAYLLRSSVALDVLAEHESALVNLYWTERGHKDGWSLMVAHQTYDLCVVDFCRFMIGWGRTSWGHERSGLALRYACDVLKRVGGDAEQSWFDRLKIPFLGV